MARINDAPHSRSLIDSIMMPEVITAVTDWITASGGAGILIGALGLPFHSRPRMTQDIDLLFLNGLDIPTIVSGFGRVGPTAFQHDATLVEGKLITPEAMHVPAEIAQHVIEMALFDSGIRIASESGLVALKLFRFSYQDQADIVALIKTGRVDVSGFPLPSEKITAYEKLVFVAVDEATRFDDPDVDKESLARRAEESAEYRMMKLDIDLSKENFEWEGPFTPEECQWHLDDYVFECDGIPEALPEPSPAEIAVVAAMAKAAGIDLSPDRLCWKR